jgi:hypothetical protein
MITKERQKEFMARTLVGSVLYKKCEFTDEECSFYNSILLLIENSGPGEGSHDQDTSSPTGTRVPCDYKVGDESGLSPGPSHTLQNGAYGPSGRPMEPTSEERKDAISTIDNLLYDADWHSPIALVAVDKLKALILAEPSKSSMVSGQEVSIPCVKKVVSREWLHDTAIILCCVGTRVDHIEQDLEARLSELGVEVEGEKETT